MVSPERDRLNITLIRCAFPFHPQKGGSVTSIEDDIQRVNSFVSAQIVVAPSNDTAACSQASNDPERTIWLPYPEVPRLLHRLGIPAQPWVLLRFAIAFVSFVRMKRAATHNIIVHIHGTLLGAFVLLASVLSRDSMPIIITQHSGNPFRISIRESLASLIAFSILVMIRPAALLIVDDGMGAGRFKKVMDRTGVKTKIVPLSIDVERFSPATHHGGKTFTVLSTSRLDSFKRVDLLIRAHSRFLRLGGSGKLKIIGGGPQKKKLHKLVTSEGISDTVDFEGEISVDEVIQRLREASVVVGTSLRSNVNRSILEAMACGKSVIVFDNGQEKKVIDHLKSGMLVNPGDIDGVADALLRLQHDQNLQLTIGGNAREYVRVNHNGRKRTEIALETYREVVHKVE